MPTVPSTCDRPVQLAFGRRQRWSNFSRPVNVMINGRAISRKAVHPDLRVLLDDVRTGAVRDCTRSGRR